MKLSGELLPNPFKHGALCGESHKWYLLKTLMRSSKFDRSLCYFSFVKSQWSSPGATSYFNANFSFDTTDLRTAIVRMNLATLSDPLWFPKGTKSSRKLSLLLEKFLKLNISTDLQTSCTCLYCESWLPVSIEDLYETTGTIYAFYLWWKPASKSDITE